MQKTAQKTQQAAPILTERETLQCRQMYERRGDVGIGTVHDGRMYMKIHRTIASDNLELCPIM